MTIALRDLVRRLLILTAAATALLGAPSVAGAAQVSRDQTQLRITEDGSIGSAEQVNDIRVTADADFIFVTDEGGTNPTPGPGCVSTGSNPFEASSKTVRCLREPADFTSIFVDVGERPDFVYLDHPDLNFITSSTINGGTGIDFLNGLLAGDDTINGGDEGDNLYGHGGNDNLRGDGGADTLYGGDGTDNLRGGAGSDDFNGGDGIDTVDYSGDSSAQVGAEINGNGNSGANCFGTGAAGSTCEGDVIRQDVENLTGTSGADLLRGNDGANTLTGLAGNDRLFGLGGADTLYGGDGDDRLRGGLDNDTIRGGNVDNTDSGTRDVVDYSEREAVAGVATDNVTVNLEAGTGGASGENDSIAGVEDAETGAADDTLIGTNSTTRGNILRGGAGNDTFRGLDGPDQFFGEAGKDLVSYQDDADGTTSDSNVVVTIGAGSNDDGSIDDGAQGARDTVNGDVEDVHGGPDDDTLTGSHVNNELDGKGGNDTLRGLDGADILIGDVGTDTVTYDDRTAGVVADLDGVEDDGNAQDGPAGQRDAISPTVENLIGGSGDDELSGNAPGGVGQSGNNSLSGANGNDLLRGDLGADSFSGGGGEDIVDYSADQRAAGVTVTIGNNAADDGAATEGDNVQADVEDIVGTSSNDLISGNASANKLFGLGGADVLNGLGGNDLLDGGAGADDTLNGGSENDVLHGGGNAAASDGADTIDGGTGNDTVTYAASTSHLDAPTADRFAVWASKERSSTVVVTLDNVRNDGAPGTPGELDSVNLVENITGGAGDDSLTGSTGAAGTAANVLDGREGNDTLNGGAEGAVPVSDTFIGGPGARDRVDYSSRGNDDDLVITLDGERNDGEVDENDDIRGDVEDVTTAGGDDHVTGNPAVPNVITTNAGTDTIRVRDSNADTVDCGADVDSVEADNRDSVDVNCENVSRPPQPLVSVSGPSPVTEGGTATFTISIDDTTAQTVTVQYATSPGTAASGQDFTPESETATIPAGSTSTTVDVQTVQDTLDEDAETFSLTISNPANATLAQGGNTASATITDDDDQPTVSVGDATLPEEGDEGTTTHNVPITLSAASSKPVTVKYTTGGGTATPNSDYTPVAEQTVTIPAGQTSANAPVQVQGDMTDEADETFVVTLTMPTNATLGDDTGTQTIIDDDGEPSLSIGDASVPEGDTGTKQMSFTVTLSSASEKTVTANYATSDGSATQPGDYEGEAGQVTFQPGTTTQTIDVTIKGDTTPEADETFTVTLSGVANATSGDTTGTGTILDDDRAAASVGNAEITEADADATFTVTLSEAPGRTVTVDYTTSDGSAVAPADYTQKSGTVTFGPTETSKQITVPVKEDALDEVNETFTVNLSSPEGVDITDGSGTGTINDDDASPSLSVADASVTEGDTGAKDLTFTVTQSAASGQAVTVKYATSDDTAKAGSDYTATSGTLTIPAGQTSGEVKVPVTGDTVDEADETLTLTLTEPGNATGTITDDEGTPSLTVGDATVAEGDAGTSRDLTFTVTQSGTSGGDVTVKYATSDGTATAGSDYTATSGTLTIPAGQTTGEIKVPVAGDGADEPDETLTLTLSEPAGATVADDSATGTITDDDQPVVPVPALSVDDIRVAEGDTGTTAAVFTVTLSAPTSATVTTKYVTSDGTATSGSDYALTAGTLTFAAGERTKTVRVNVIGDRRDESDESFALALVDPQGATLAKGTGGALITDDETPRVAPRQVIARTTPSRDRSLPFRFRTSGRVTLPSGVRRSDACAGKVQVRFKAGKKTISTRRTSLRRDCTFSRRVSFGIRSRLRPGRLKVQVRFLGNAVLLPKSAARRFVRVR